MLVQSRFEGHRLRSVPNPELQISESLVVFRKELYDLFIECGA